MRMLAALLSLELVVTLLNLVWPSQPPKAQITIQKTEYNLRLKDLQLGIGLGPNPRGRSTYVCSKEITENDRWMGLSYPNLKDAWRGKTQGLAIHPTGWRHRHPQRRPDHRRLHRLKTSLVGTDLSTGRNWHARPHRPLTIRDFLSHPG